MPPPFSALLSEAAALAFKCFKAPPCNLVMLISGSSAQTYIDLENAMTLAMGNKNVAVGLRVVMLYLSMFLSLLLSIVVFVQGTRQAVHR
jgi:hypothetical protein